MRDSEIALDIAILRLSLASLLRLLARIRGFGRPPFRSNGIWEDGLRSKEFDDHAVLDEAELAERELEKIRDGRVRYY